MSETRSGEIVSAQIGKMGAIDNLANADFSLPDGQCFNIKNDGTQPTVNASTSKMTARNRSNYRCSLPE